MPQRAFHAGIAAFAAALAFLSAEPGRAEPRDLLEYLPEDALIAIHAPNAKELIAAWDGSALGRFGNDPRAAACLAPLRKRIADLETRLPGGDPKSLDRALQCLTGSAVLAAVPAGKDSDSPYAWVAIAEDDGSPLVRQIVEGKAFLGRDGWIQKALSASMKRPFDRITVHRQAPAAAPIQTRAQLSEIPMGGKSKGKKAASEPKPAKAAPAQLDRIYHEYFGKDVFIHADESGSYGPPIREILNRMDGVAPRKSLRALLKERNIRATDGEDKAGPRIEIYANLRELGSIYQKGKGDSDLSNPIRPERLGLDGADWLAVSLGFGKEGLELRGRIAAPVPPRGIGRLLFIGGKTPPDATAWIPGDAVDYSAASISLPKAYDFAMDLFGGPDDPVKALVEAQLAAFSRASGIDARRDLVDNLSGGIVRFVPRIQQDGGSGLQAPLADPTVWMLEASDPGAVKRGIEAMLEYGTQVFGAYQLEKSERKEGAAVWTLRSGRPSAGYAGAPLMTVAMAGPWAMLSRRSEGIEAALAAAKSPESSMKRRADFKEAAGGLPAGRFAEGFADFGGLLRLIDGKFLPRSPVGGSGEANAGWIDPSAAPDAKTISEFFGPFARGFSQGGDGMAFEAFLPLRGAKEASPGAGK